MPNDVQTMQPMSNFNPLLRTRTHKQSASVNPPVLSSFTLIAS
jgi:hypothetical protein